MTAARALPAPDGVVARLVAALAPERIVMFGSWARSRPGARSDIDLLVVADWTGEPEQHLRRARHLVARSFPPVDLVLCRPEDLDDRNPAPRQAFLLSAVQTGVTLYSRT